MRRLIMSLLGLVLYLGLTAAAAWAAAGPRIVLDGLELRPDVPPYVSGGRTMVPLRVVSENLSAVVDWNKARQEVTVVQEGKTISLTVGSDRALVNGEFRALDAPAAVRSGRTFVPLRFVSEALGCAVGYQPGVVTITSPDDGSRVFLLEANKAHLGLSSVRFRGTLQTGMKFTGGGTAATDSIKTEIEGWSKNPDQSYVLMKMTGLEWSETSEVYLDGKNEYRRQDGGKWTVAPVLTGRPPDAGMQDPAVFAQNLRRTAGLVQELGVPTRFAADTRVNGQVCRVVVYQLNKDRLAGVGGALFGEAAFAFAEQVKLEVRTYIARETGLLVRETVKLEMAWGAAPDGRTVLTMTGGFDFTEHGREVTPPDVSGAVAVRP